MTRRLQALRVGNFKAFADTQRIPLKPITLIFGPNSAGKSSFIHSLALAHEAQFGREKRSLTRLDVHHTDVGGSAIDLGGFRQYVHRGQLNKHVEWGAEIKVSSLSQDKDQRLAQLLAPVSSVALNIALGIELDDQDRPKLGAEPRVDSIEITTDGAELLRMSRRPASGHSDLHPGHLRLDRLATDHLVFRQVLKAIVEAQTTSEEMRPEDFDGANEAVASLLPELLVHVDQFFPSRVELTRGDGGDTSPVNMLFPISKGNRMEDVAQAVRLVLPRTLNDLIKGLADVLADELKQLQYLGPLRSFPPRHLAFAEHEDANWYAGGGYAWDVVRKDSIVRSLVNQWLGAEKMNTKYQLKVLDYYSSDTLPGRLESAITNRYHAMYKHSLLQDHDFVIPQNDLATTALQYGEEIAQHIDDQEYERVCSQHEEEILENPALLQEPHIEAAFLADHIDTHTASAVEHRAPMMELVLFDERSKTFVTHRDVGIGISQVLPVLVAAYGSERKLIAMEQPEIHLHPALQAELADVFIESAIGDQSNTFILETHSEHLILRLLRRIREGYEASEAGNAPTQITANDVAIFYFKPDSNGTSVVEIPITQDGEFAAKWPDGFFPERAQELFG